MTDDDDARSRDKTRGEALFASTLVSVLIQAIVPPDKAVLLIDLALLTLERNQALDDAGPGPIAHARERFEGLLELFRGSLRTPPTATPSP